MDKAQQGQVNKIQDSPLHGKIYNSSKYTGNSGQEDMGSSDVLMKKMKQGNCCRCCKQGLQSCSSPGGQQSLPLYKRLITSIIVFILVFGVCLIIIYQTYTYKSIKQSATQIEIVRVLIIACCNAFIIFNLERLIVNKYC